MSMKNKKQFAQFMANHRNNLALMKAKEQGFGVAMVFVCWVLHDKNGFGNKRLEKLIDEVWTLSDDLVKGYIDADDLLQQLEKETQIKIFKGRVIYVEIRM